MSIPGSWIMDTRAHSTAARYTNGDATDTDSAADTADDAGLGSFSPSSVDTMGHLLSSPDTISYLLSSPEGASIELPRFPSGLTPSFPLGLTFPRGLAPPTPRPTGDGQNENGPRQAYSRQHTGAEPGQLNHTLPRRSIYRHRSPAGRYYTPFQARWERELERARREQAQWLGALAVCTIVVSGVLMVVACLLCFVCTDCSGVSGPVVAPAVPGVVYGVVTLGGSLDAVHFTGPALGPEEMEMCSACEALPVLFTFLGLTTLSAHRMLRHCLVHVVPKIARTSHRRSLRRALRRTKKFALVAWVLTVAWLELSVPSVYRLLISVAWSLACLQ